MALYLLMSSSSTCCFLREVVVEREVVVGAELGALLGPEGTAGGRSPLRAVVCW